MSRRGSLSTRRRVGEHAITAGRWRAVCTCGAEFRAVTRRGAEDRFFDHVQLEHLDLTQEEE